MARRPKTTVAKARRGDATRVIVVGCALAAVAGLAYVIGTGDQSQSLREAAFTPSQKKSEDLTTGAVVFVPPLGDECRQKTIDNRTWEIRDQGPVSCKDALEASKQRRTGGSSRMDIIRDSFRK